MNNRSPIPIDRKRREREPATPASTEKRTPEQSARRERMIAEKAVTILRDLLAGFRPQKFAE